MRIALFLVLLFPLMANGQFLINPYRFGTTSTLNTGLTAYWKLDESSDGSAPVTRVDSGPNGQDLTDNGTTASTTGIISNAGQFVIANSENLSHADSATLDTGDIDFTFSAWVYLDSTATVETILSKWNTTNNREYFLYFNNTSSRFEWRASSDGSSGAATTVRADNFGAPSVSTWYNIVAWHDSVANVLGIAVNAGTANTAAHTTGVFVGDSTFRIGARSETAADFFGGRIDEVGFWKKVLSSAERTELYNAGAGKTCCPFAAP